MFFCVGHFLLLHACLRLEAVSRFLSRWTTSFVNLCMGNQEGTISTVKGQRTAKHQLFSFVWLSALYRQSCCQIISLPHWHAVCSHHKDADGRVCIHGEACLSWKHGKNHTECYQKYVLVFIAYFPVFGFLLCQLCQRP